MTAPENLPELFSKAQAIEEQIKTYNKSGIPDKTATSHVLLKHKTLVHNITNDLAKLTGDVSRLLPAHWSPLSIFPVFERNGYFAITQIKPKSEEKAHIESGDAATSQRQMSRLGDTASFDARSFIRYVGMIFETVQMNDARMNKRCAARMDKLEQPHRFETRKPFSMHVSTHGDFSIKEAYSLHDAYGQVIVQGERWTLREMMTRSQRKDFNESFEDGRKALRRKYFNYLDQSWMLDVKIATEIFDLNFLTKAEKSTVVDCFQFKNSDVFLQGLLRLLRGSDKKSLANYVCFPTKGSRHKSIKSQIVEAYSPAHALVKDQLQRMAPNSIERNNLLEGVWTEWSVSKVQDAQTITL